MTAYQGLSLQAKQRAAIASQREQTTVCPKCEAQVMPVDLLPHMADRCTGERDPHPAATWVSWSAALSLGVPKRTLLWWIERGYVRRRGERGDRRYLLRDLVRRTAVNRRR